jgi:succinate dehydrogenase/fumarate reductase-like Fe-S protein
MLHARCGCTPGEYARAFERVNLVVGREYDPRRARAAAERLELLDGRDGVWKCRTVFNCVEACPRDIDITGAIADVKRALLFRKD